MSDTFQKYVENELCQTCNERLGLFYISGGREKRCMNKNCGINYGRILKETNSEFIMPFGKHKGMSILEMPLDYLNWGKDNLNGNIQKRFQEELEQRRKVS